MRRFFFLVLFVIFITRLDIFCSGKYDLSGNGKNRKEKINDLQKAIISEEKEGDFSALEKDYFTLAKISLEEDDYLNSLSLFFKAKIFSERIDGPLRGKIYLNISELFRVMGRVGVSKKYLNSAYGFSMKSKDIRLRIKIYNLFGDIAFDDKRFSKALNYYKSGAYLCVANGFFSEMAETSYRISMDLLMLGKKLIGMKILKDVIDNLLKKRYTKDLLPKLFQYVNRLINSGKIDNVSDYLKTAFLFFSPFEKEYFFLDYLSGRLAENKGDRYRALKLYRSALYRMDGFFAGMGGHILYKNKNTIKDIYSGIAEFFFKMFDWTNKTEYLRQAVYISEVKNSYIYKWEASGENKYKFIKTELKRIENDINNLVKRTKGFSEKIAGTLSIDEQLKKLRDLYSQKMDISEFLKELRIKFTKYKLKDLDPVGLMTSLDRDSLILKFVVLGDHIYVIVIDKTSIGYKKISVSAEKIFKEINSLMRPVSDFSKGKVDLLHVKYNIFLSKKIYRDLISDVLEFHKDKKILYIIPDAMLFLLPFEALVTEIREDKTSNNIYFSEYNRASFLIERYSISYFFSLFQFKKRRSIRTKKFKISVFGDPEINNDLLSGSDLLNRLNYLGNIPSVAEEISEIKKIFGNISGKYYTKENFTLKNFIRDANKSKILHIATHYIANKKFPGYSSIICSPGKENVPLIYTSDIAKLKLNSDLVVLSACESAEGNLRGEQSIKGLAASLYKAGVTSLIASFWPVDQFNSKIIPLLYKKIGEGNINPENLTKILRDVKIDFMKKIININGRINISLRHPLIWANFVLYNFYI